MKTTAITQADVKPQASPPMDLIHSASAAFAMFSDAKSAASHAIAAVLSNKVKVGDVVDLREIETRRCGHYQALRTYRGRDHGTRVFRIETAPIVDFFAHTPILSTWTCEATPVSEKTGKDMDGAAGHNSRKTVTLTSYVFRQSIPEDITGEAYTQYCMDIIEKFFQ